MKKLISILMSLLVIPMLCFISISAQEIDLEKKGSLTISFTENYPLTGSSYALWHVAKIEAPEGSYEYVNTEKFADVHFTWTNEDIDYWDKQHSASLIAFVGSYIDLNEIEPDYTGTITENNKITFDNLDLGIYYVRQTKTGPAGYVMTSYLATIPNGEEDPESDGYYNVTSNAKTDPYRPTTPDRPDPTPRPDPDLPDTNRPGTNNPNFNLPGTNSTPSGNNTTNTTTNNTTTTSTDNRSGFNLPNTAAETQRNMLLLLAAGALLVGTWALWKSRKEAAR